jgi:hypothetical protein
MAQMEDELQRRVIKIVKEQHDVLTHQTGIDPSLDEHELKQYLYETIQEIKRTSTSSIGFLFSQHFL